MSRPGEADAHVVAEAAGPVDADLEGRRRRLALDAVHAHPVGSHLLELDRVEARRHVRAEVLGPADLVEQLRRDGADGDLAAGSVVLADHRRAVRRDLGPREADPLHAGDLGEEGVVAAGGLGAALDHVARRHRAGQGVPVVRLQPWCHAAGPQTTAASVVRPVITMSAPAFSASTMPQQPR